MAAAALGLLICLLAWLGLRASAGAGLRGPALGFVIDVVPFVLGFALLLLATARPVLSGVGVAALAVGLGTVDRVKRVVLQEPVVFADRSELLEVVRHPQLYLPFAGTARVLAGGAAILVLAAAAFWAEPALWQVGIPAEIGLAALAPVLACCCFIVPTSPPLLRRLSRGYERLGLTREPAIDAARLGLLGSCVMHATVARNERPRLRLAAARARLAELPGDGSVDAGGPIIIVQAESFMNAAQLHPSLAGAMPELARLQRDAVRYGRLSVPCWGANTIRSEFAVLTGLAEGRLGLDRFNPYSGFLDAATPSLVRQARAAGYTTICVHPFDLRFYGRDRALPLLGFDRLIGQEAFRDAPRDGAYVADIAVAAMLAELVERHGPRTLVLAITMQNHGPWTGMATLAPPAPLPPELAGIAEPHAFGRWLHHAKGTDAMLPVLTRCLRDTAGRTGLPGWLMLYGDHQPSLAAVFASLRARDPRTDYVIWKTDRTARPRQEDCAAHELAHALLASINARAPAERSTALA